MLRFGALPHHGHRHYKHGSCRRCEGRERNREREKGRKRGERERERVHSNVVMKIQRMIETTTKLHWRMSSSFKQREVGTLDVVPSEIERLWDTFFSPSDHLRDAKHGTLG